jgi:hypothetical protein
MRQVASLFFAVSSVALLSACGGGGGGNSGGGNPPPPPPPPAITVAFSQSFNTVPADSADTKTVRVQVGNDSASAGVTWSLTAGGANCSPACGTLAPAPAPSFSASYTPPLTQPSGANASPSISAASVTSSSSTASDAFTITAPAVTVAIIDDFSQLVVGIAPVTVHARVTGDASNSGITAAITAGGSACAPMCGTLGPVSGSNGALTFTYAPPLNVPASPNDHPTITISSVVLPSATASLSFELVLIVGDSCPPGGGEVQMGPNGTSWAFLLRGFNDGIPVAMAGSFAVDGNGDITGGAFNVNQLGQSPQVLQSFTVNTAYSVDTEGNGCLQLGINGTIAGFEMFHFVLSAYDSNNTGTDGQIIEFDDNTGTGQRMTGILRRQDPSPFSTAAFTGGHTLGLSGWDGSNPSLGHAAMAGYFSTDGMGGVTTDTLDLNDAGTLGSQHNTNAGAFEVGSQGLGVVSLELPNGMTLAATVYAVNSTEAILISQVPATSAVPLLSGSMFASGTSFSQSTVKGNYIAEGQGFEPGSNTSYAFLQLLDFDGTASLSGTTWADDGVNIDQGGVALSGGVTYTVGADTGRVTLTGDGTSSPMMYVFPAINVPINGASGFILSGGTDGALGEILFQSTTPPNYVQTSVKFTYSLGDVDDTSSQDVTQVGLVQFANTNQVFGDVLESGPVSPFLQIAVPYNFTFTLNPDGSGNFGANTAFVTNVNHLYLLDQSAANPKITVFELQNRMSP